MFLETTMMMIRTQIVLLPVLLQKALTKDMIILQVVLHLKIIIQPLEMLKQTHLLEVEKREIIPEVMLRVPDNREQTDLIHLPVAGKTHKQKPVLLTIADFALITPEAHLLIRLLLQTTPQEEVVFHNLTVPEVVIRRQAEAVVPLPIADREAQVVQEAAVRVEQDDNNFN